MLCLSFVTMHSPSRLSQTSPFTYTRRRREQVYWALTTTNLAISFNYSLSISILPFIPSLLRNDPFSEQPHCPRTHPPRLLVPTMHCLPNPPLCTLSTSTSTSIYSTSSTMSTMTQPAFCSYSLKVLLSNPNLDPRPQHQPSSAPHHHNSKPKTSSHQND